MYAGYVISAALRHDFSLPISAIARDVADTLDRLRETRSHTEKSNDLRRLTTQAESVSKTVEFLHEQVSTVGHSLRGHPAPLAEVRRLAAMLNETVSEMHRRATSFAGELQNEGDLTCQAAACEITALANRIVEMHNEIVEFAAAITVGPRASVRLEQCVREVGNHAGRHSDAITSPIISIRGAATMCGCKHQISRLFQVLFVFAMSRASKLSAPEFDCEIEEVSGDVLRHRYQDLTRQTAFAGDWISIGFTDNGELLEVSKRRTSLASSSRIPPTWLAGSMPPEFLDGRAHASPFAR